jgi:rRNA-processing protein FCF1
MDEISISSDEDVADLVSRKQNLQVSIQNVESRKMLIPGKTVIIFDTNMLLRNFAIVKKILESKCYPIVVPLTIIMELSGLAENKEKPHICDIATDILKYLKENLKSGKFVIESIKGNVLNSLDYLNEEWGSHIASADDAILAVCRNHSSVFLITDDKNLRLKARTVKVSVLSNLKQLV